MRLGQLKPGDIFKLENERWVVLSINPNNHNVLVEAYSPVFAASFSDSESDNRWNTSDLVKSLQMYLKESILDRAPHLTPYIVPIHRDLTAFDGRVDYGGCTDNITLLTAAEYAQLKDILAYDPCERLLITPCTTEEGGSDVDIVFVDVAGNFDFADINKVFWIKPVMCIQPDMEIAGPIPCDIK